MENIRTHFFCSLFTSRYYLGLMALSYSLSLRHFEKGHVELYDFVVIVKGVWEHNMENTSLTNFSFLFYFFIVVVIIKIHFGHGDSIY
jgi:hypothetical protein